MRILIVGGGPGGLFFAILAKQRHPDYDVDVVEQNPQGATYGWGVGFSESAIRALRTDAPDVVDEITAREQWPDTLDVIVDDKKVSLRGFPLYRIGRTDLLGLLERTAENVGVKLEYEQRIEQVPPATDYDLVVGADGVNSVIRGLLADDFQPDVRVTRNWWAWYGTTRPFTSTSLIFLQRPEGLIIGHAYSYLPDRSGFVVEVTPDFFERHGFAALDDNQSRQYCTDLFADQLGGHELLSNRSLWFQPQFVSCQRWSAAHVVLLGDALHTVHPSISSGTRFAMRDAAALADAVDHSNGDVPAALQLYEHSRRKRADGFQRAATRSIAWYEGLAHRRISDPEMFAIEFAMRTGSVRWAEFRRGNPELVSRFESPTTRDSQR